MLKGNYAMKINPQKRLLSYGKRRQCWKLLNYEEKTNNSCELVSIVSFVGTQFTEQSMFRQS